MPDPAIEAFKAGMDYTEPTGKGVKKAKVSYEFVVDPNNPHAPPRQRRVIETADSGGGIFGKLFKGEKTITSVPVRPLFSQGMKRRKYRVCRLTTDASDDNAAPATNRIRLVR
jgi:hypothetical protein